MLADMPLGMAAMRSLQAASADLLKDGTTVSFHAGRPGE
jgi:hypothetical protein